MAITQMGAVSRPAAEARARVVVGVDGRGVTGMTMPSSSPGTPADASIDNMSSSDISSVVMSDSMALTPIAVEVLLSLLDGPQHGYGIKLDIEARTHGELSLGSGTLYQAIQRLERDGCIAAVKNTAEPADPRRGRSYRLQSAGRAALQTHLRRMQRTVDFARARKVLPTGRS